MTDGSRPSPARLRERLEDFDELREMLRIVAVLNYEHGVSPERIATMYGISERTVYNWLRRFEERPLERAVSDRARPGRPPALSAPQRARLAEAVSSPPAESGLDADDWTGPVLRRFVRDRFDVAYSERHAARLLDRLGADGG